MTVSSLWAVLDEAGCGTPVGIDDFNLRGRGTQPNQQTILAVDLSIWICEGITSTALSTFHSDPALHLVYQRTTKLLKLGIGLVFVVEGQRRVRVSSQTTSSSSSQTHELKQRRSGSQFWNASKRCEAMLQFLGVPVVRAEAEGEALCALLNRIGLVDGIISNDGDCLLFGAKTLYTAFSAENLEARKVIRYDAEKLVANLDNGNNSSRTIKLSREDLIAFAVLSGSDMCGDGVPNVGHKKAIQFLHACRSLKDQCDDRTCIDELLSWGDVAAESTKSKDICLNCDDDGPSNIPSRCCSLCLHPGNKLQHEKHGCAECGTGPGEGCYVVTSSEKVLSSLREKARGLIAPRHIVNGYFTPNSNDVPSSLSSLKSKPYAVSVNAAVASKTSMILKGRTNESSQEYIKQTLPKLIARLDLWDTRPRNIYVTPKQRYKTIPTRIEKILVKQSWPCYEITWSINFHPTSEDEQFQFCTFECQSLVNSNFPQLVKAFYQEERRRQQGRAEDERRTRFTGTNNNGQHRNQSKRRDLSKKLQQKGCRRKRERTFDVDRTRKVQKTTMGQAPSNDVSMLMDHLQFDEPVEENDEFEFEQFEESGEKECGQVLTHDIQRDVIDIEGSSDAERSMSVADGKIDHYDDNCGLKSCAIDDIIGYADDCLRTNDSMQKVVQDYTGLDCGDLPYSPPGGVVRLKTYEDVSEETYDHQHFSLSHDGHLDDTFRGGSWDMTRQSSGVSDGNGYSDDYLCSGDQNEQKAQGDGTLDFGNLSHGLSPSERVFCDMGIIQIEVTPIISRRW